MHTPREAGPSRTVPGATGWRHESLGDDAATPRQAARCRRDSKRWLANSDHRGTCGANLKHCARDAGEKADLRFRHYPDGGLGRDRRSASVSRDIEARGSAGPPASRPPRTSEGASADMTRTQSRRGNEACCLKIESEMNNARYAGISASACGWGMAQAFADQPSRQAQSRAATDPCSTAPIAPITTNAATMPAAMTCCRDMANR